jgi:hypothetical protein
VKAAVRYKPDNRGFLALALLVACRAEAPAATGPASEKAAPQALGAQRAPRAAADRTVPQAANSQTTPPTAADPTVPQAANSPPTPPATAPVQFGTPLGKEPLVDFATLLAEPGAYREQAVQVQGVVRQVCQRRGCWLELATDMTPNAPGCRVLLKGHAFFVPIDSAGAVARLAGSVEVQTIAAAQVAHMEEEGGRFANKHPDGTASEVRIVASGVELARK